MDCPEKIIRIVESVKNENPCELEIRFKEPMSEHSTFKLGGLADCWIQPRGEGFPKFTAALLKAAKEQDVPVFILGGGANIVVSDEGIRGIVLYTGGWAGLKGKGGDRLEFRSGTGIDEAAKIAADAGLSGMEFLAGMPGSIGGAVYMNARSYGREISDALIETELIDGESFEILRLAANRNEFSYKKSPFQQSNMFILSAVFQLTKGDTKEIYSEMKKNRNDREEKGHYRFPSAGCVFKNNPLFGKSTGKIIDELGLKGMAVGAVQISPWHGNIIINKGGAKAIDIFNLVNETAAKVKSATGFDLETEILFIGSF